LDDADAQARYDLPMSAFVVGCWDGSLGYYGVSAREIVAVQAKYAEASIARVCAQTT